MKSMTSPQTKMSYPGRVSLEKIVEATRIRVARLRKDRTAASLLEDSAEFTRRSFHSAISKNAPAIISEVKKASPSRGVLRTDFDPIRLATDYQTGGAAAISVVTEPEFFQGDDSWIAQIRTRTSLPILRKDFVLDPIQVAQSASLGADAILLIARLLTTAHMQELRASAAEVGMAVLFEAHDETDLEKINQCEPRIVGINARNLDTFIVDTDQFARLRSLIPKDAIAVAESGFDSHDQILAAYKLGYSGILIGETLVKSSNPAATLRMLRTGAST